MTEMDRRHEAFETLVTPYLPLLWRCARRMVYAVHDAEDVMQETCLKAFRAFHQFQPGTDARAWLLTILLNTYRDWVRKMLRQPDMLDLDDITDLYRQYYKKQAPALAYTPEKAAGQAERGRLVRLALDDLPPEFRMTVLLADIEGCTYQEIADIMGCPIGTVMSRLHRARRLLRTTLQAVLED